MITEKDIVNLVEAIHDIAKIKGENEALRKENEYLRGLVSKQFNLPPVVGQSELLCPRCNSPLIYKREYTDGYSCNNCFHDWA